jgi:transposase-like protein
MQHISQERKESIFRKMMSPDAPSISRLAKEEGIAESTLYNWRHQLSQEGRPVPQPERKKGSWTAQAKFAIIVETASLNEAEVADYCRGKGLYPEEVKGWRDIAIGAQNGHVIEQAVQQKAMQSYQKKIKDLQREVDRKNKALAEAAALLVLQKKLHALWNEGEDE